LANPHEYTLVYGSPVPGYAAPLDTIDPASRIVRLLVGLAVNLDTAGAPTPTKLKISKNLKSDISNLLTGEATKVERQRLLAVANAWALLFGMISFEVFGRYIGMFEDQDAFFDHQINRAGATFGLEP
jgi:hypothetical protein